MFHGILVIRHLNREPDFWARNRYFASKVLNMISKVFLALFDIWADFLSREPDLQKILKKPQSMFSWRFLSIFSIFRHLSREPDFLAENRIFKKPYMFSWCFLGVLMYFSIVRNLSREPDFWAENRIFKNLSKSLKTCFLVFSGCFKVFFRIVRHLSREPDEPRTRFSKKI